MRADTDTLLHGQLGKMFQLAVEMAKRQLDLHTHHLLGALAIIIEGAHTEDHTLGRKLMHHSSPVDDPIRGDDRLAKLFDSRALQPIGDDLHIRCRLFIVHHWLLLSVGYALTYAEFCATIKSSLRVFARAHTAVTGRLPLVNPATTSAHLLRPLLMS